MRLVLGLLFNSTILARSRTTFELPNAKTLAAQESSEARVLEAGQTVERELRGGEQHSYRIALASGQYARVSVEQRGVNVALALYGPGGARLAETDKSNAAQGAETLSFVAATAGYSAGEAETLETLGDYYLSLNDHEKAQACYEQAATYWRNADDHASEGCALRRLGNFHGSLGDRRKEADCYEQALALHRAAGARQGEADVFNRYGWLY